MHLASIDIGPRTIGLVQAPPDPQMAGAPDAALPAKENGAP